MDETDVRPDWWPAMDTLVASLRRAGGVDAADARVADVLVDAVRGGATSSEILGRVGVVLRAHDARRARLDAPARAAWDAVMADVDRPYPLRALAYRTRRLLERLRIL